MKLILESMIRDYLEEKKHDLMDKVDRYRCMAENSLVQDNVNNAIRHQAAYAYGVDTISDVLDHLPKLEADTIEVPKDGAIIFSFDYDYGVDASIVDEIQSIFGELAAKGITPVAIYNQDLNVMSYENKQSMIADLEELLNQLKGE